MMSTSILNAEIALSKELGDYWAGTTTSDGAAGGTTLVDTALKAKANAWITDEAYDYIAEGTYNEEERKISSLDNSDGTLTVLAHGGKIVSGIDYRVHRLFSASDKRRALIAAARRVFPALFKEVLDVSLVSGNWLKDGSFEQWDDANTLTDWTSATCTVTQTSTAGYVRHGTYSCKIDTAAGTVSVNISNDADLQFLRGRSVTFTIQAHCDTANCLRISINDGSTQTYSDYHDGDSAWTKDNPRNDDMYVTQYIDPNATQITMTIHHGVAAATSYVDDARLISNPRAKLYVGHLGLAQNRPHVIEMEPKYYSQQEPWQVVRDYTVDKDGYLYLPTNYLVDRRLRIKGIGYLDFLDSSGDSSDNWDSTIAIDSPQLNILVAEAAVYLYTQMSLPNYETGDRKQFQESLAYWKQEVADRKAQFGMYYREGATVHFGVR
jgi:hypothetical protein